MILRPFNRKLSLNLQDISTKISLQFIIIQHVEFQQKNQNQVFQTPDAEGCCAVHLAAENDGERAAGERSLAILLGSCANQVAGWVGG